EAKLFLVCESPRQIPLQISSPVGQRQTCEALSASDIHRRDDVVIRNAIFSGHDNVGAILPSLFPLRQLLCQLDCVVFGSTARVRTVESPRSAFTPTGARSPRFKYTKSFYFFRFGVFLPRRGAPPLVDWHRPRRVGSTPP